MSKITYFVGLDYHQDSVQVCVMDKQGNVLVNATRPNDWQEVASVVPQGGKVFAAIEACCGAADFAEELINQAAWSVDLAHPGYVARIKQGPDKTDWADAKLLADLERVGYLPKVWLPPQQIRELWKLVRYCSKAPRAVLSDWKPATWAREFSRRSDRRMGTPELPSLPESMHTGFRRIHPPTRGVHCHPLDSRLASSQLPFGVPTESGSSPSRRKPDSTNKQATQPKTPLTSDELS